MPDRATRYCVRTGCRFQTRTTTSSAGRKTRRPHCSPECFVIERRARRVVAMEGPEADSEARVILGLYARLDARGVPTERVPEVFESDDRRHA